MKFNSEQKEQQAIETIFIEYRIQMSNNNLHKKSMYTNFLDWRSIYHCLSVCLLHCQARTNDSPILSKSY